MSARRRRFHHMLGSCVCGHPHGHLLLHFGDLGPYLLGCVLYLWATWWNWLYVLLKVAAVELVRESQLLRGDSISGHLLALLVMGLH